MDVISKVNVHLYFVVRLEKRPVVYTVRGVPTDDKGDGPWERGV